MSKVQFKCSDSEFHVPYELQDRVFEEFPDGEADIRMLSVRTYWANPNVRLFHADRLLESGLYLTKTVGIDVRQLAGQGTPAEAVEQAINALANMQWRESSLFDQDCVEQVSLAFQAEVPA